MNKKVTVFLELCQFTVTVEVEEQTTLIRHRDHLQREVTYKTVSPKSFHQCIYIGEGVRVK